MYTVHVFTIYACRWCDNREKAIRVFSVHVKMESVFHKVKTNMHTNTPILTETVRGQRHPSPVMVYVLLI